MSDYFVHSSAIVSPQARIGVGAKIWHFCHVMADAELGPDVVLGQNCFVAEGVVVGRGSRIQNNVSLYRGVTLGADVFIGPSVVFTNVSRPRAAFPRRDSFEKTHVGDGASIGTNATVVCGVNIGAGVLVGAGAVVTRDLPPFALAVGVPARVVGWVCRCGESLSAASRESRLEGKDASSDDRELTCGDRELTCGHCGRRYLKCDNGIDERD